MLRARASGVWSPTELPSRTLPRRLVVPLANSNDSSSVVLPDRYGPTRATTRGALGIGDPPQIRGAAASAAAAVYDRIVARRFGGGKFDFRDAAALAFTSPRPRKEGDGPPGGNSASHIAAEDRQQQDRDDVGDLDHRVDRRPRGVLVRIADRVAGHRCLVRLRPLAAVMAFLDVFLGVVPGAAARGHRDCDEQAG